MAELLAGADANTWLVWFQHHPVVRMIAGGGNTELQARLPDLCIGRARVGVAFSHLRSARPTISAVADGDGWRLSGHQPWCTGWGLIDVILVGAVTEDDQVMLALRSEWVAGDAMRASNVQPLAIGISLAALEVLRERPLSRQRRWDHGWPSCASGPMSCRISPRPPRTPTSASA